MTPEADKTWSAIWREGARGPDLKALAAALAQARSEGRKHGLEEAARRCELLAHRPRGNDYGNIGNAYDECADEIRSLLNQGRDEVAPNSPDFSGPSREEK